MICSLALTALCQLPAWERTVLSSDFLCEGASVGDLDMDGDADVVAGPWWYEGPAFRERHALYPATPFDPAGYSDHFFSWVLDLDGDAKNDVFVVGFPGQAAYWLRNPGEPDGNWERFPVIESVENESPAFLDVNGDGQRDLVCQNGERIGWAEADPADPRKPWIFHAATANGMGGHFTHGLGAGDLNGDGRVDILRKEGWWEQPASLAGDPAWAFHPVAFSPAYGGAQMLVTDVDGDGDADVISSYAAHSYGLAWFEQGAAGEFTAHELLSAAPSSDNVSELHALALADLDGDGVQDFVTGKRWRSHNRSEVGADDPPHTLAFYCRRENGGVRFEMQSISDATGVGVDVTAADATGDGRADVIVANKRGAFVLRQLGPQDAARASAGGNLGFEDGSLAGWTAEGAAFAGQPVRGDAVQARRADMVSNHDGGWWIGGFELAGDGPQGTLTSAAFAVEQPWASFLIGGGASEETRAEIVREADGVVLFSTSGANHETLQRVVVDLAPYAGQSVFLRLVDQSSAGWGHLNFDDFRFHAEEPSFAPPPGVRAVHPYPALQESGFEPAAAARAMTVPEGFRVELIAGEPDLHQPVALHVDERGRIWVAEAYSYPARVPDAEARDAIVVFEDADANGSYEKRTVFHDRLNLVSGLATGFGGVWVGAAPYLMFIPDRNGDLVPDAEPEILLDGFGYQDTHETLNSFTWGPDGWLYGTHGVFTHSKVGKPGTPEAQRVGLNAGVWRYQSQRREFEIFAWGTSNPWGVDFDDRGQAFITACVIPHLWHMVQGGRYERQGGRHFDAFPWLEIGTIGDHVHYAGDVAEHAWWGRDRSVADPNTDQAGGGHAHCGALVYVGNLFPAEYRNAVLMNNIHGNRVNQDRLERAGSGYVGVHAPDLVKSNDQWYRGIALRQGPGGEVYFIDWYDKNACHRNEREIWDRTNGRLYRLTYGSAVDRKVSLRESSDLELVDLQEHPDDWVVRNARRLLQERGVSPQVKAALRARLESHPDPLRKLRFLWALHCVGGLEDAVALQLLSSPHEDVRAWTIQLALEDRAAPASFLAKLADLAQHDPAPVVRLYLASALQRLPADQRWAIAAALLARAEDAADKNVPVVLWYGVEPLVAADAKRAIALAAGAQLSGLADLLWRRCAVGAPAQLEALIQASAEAAPPLAQRMLTQMWIGLQDKPGMEMPAAWKKVSAKLLGSPDTGVREAAGQVALFFGDVNLAPLFRARLADAAHAPEGRRQALDGLARMQDKESAPLILNSLADPELQTSALQACASWELIGAPLRILENWESFDPDERELAMSALTGRPAYAREFLATIAAGRASARLLDAAGVRRQLADLRDPETDRLLEKAWGRSVATSSDAKAEIARYKALLTPDFMAGADPAAGRALFARTCIACHTLFGTGGTLGPDITGGNRADLDFILGNLVDPSAEVGREYQLTTVRMKDGRVLAGTVVREDAERLTLRTSTGDQVLLLRDLKRNAQNQPDVERSQFSLMPPGQLQALKEDEVRDLIAYLASPRQTLLAAAPETLPYFFDGKTLAGWEADPAVWSVENGEIVGRSAAGLERNSFARSTLRFADFRLIVDVKLPQDADNGGIQFRSEGLEDGEVRGYQADVGAGWWGKLYEELGRGLLVDSPAGSAAVRAGEWTSYEIVASGERILLAVNGVKTADLTDTEGARAGILALQLHSGGPSEIRFRNFRFELDPQPVLKTVR